MNGKVAKLDQTKIATFLTVESNIKYTRTVNKRTYIVKKVKKKADSSSWEPRLRATGRHLPYHTVLPATRHK